MKTTTMLSAVRERLRNTVISKYYVTEKVYPSSEVERTVDEFFWPPPPPAAPPFPSPPPAVLALPDPVPALELARPAEPKQVRSLC